MYAYSDGHTGEFDNYFHQPNPDTLTVYAYHTLGDEPGTPATYSPAHSMLYRRTDRTVEGDRAEDPDAWEPTTTDTYSPDHDVNPGLTGDELAVDGVIWGADFSAPVPPLPDGWPTMRPLIAAPARPGWTGADVTIH